MIKIQDSVPGIYYNSSRDFQFIGHLFDLVLNALKTDVDLLFNLPLSINSDDQLLELMTYTFGIRLDSARYTSKQLRALCSVIPQMMRAKGSSKAVQLLCTALMHAEGLEDLYSIELATDHTKLTLYLSSLSTSRELILDILPYILPAGMLFEVVSAGKSGAVEHRTNSSFKDSVRYTFNDASSELVKPDSLAADASIFSNTSNTDSLGLDLDLKLKPNIAFGAALTKPAAYNQNPNTNNSQNEED